MMDNFEAVSKIMNREVVTVRSTDLVGDTVLRFVGNWIGGAPVVDEHDIVEGVITDGDLVKAIWQLREGAGPFQLSELAAAGDLADDWEAGLYELLRQPIARLMTTDVITVDEETSVAEAARLMTEHRIKKLPVVRDGRLVGLVSRGDLVLSILGRRCADLFPQPDDEELDG